MQLAAALISITMGTVSLTSQRLMCTDTCSGWICNICTARTNNGNFRKRDDQQTSRMSLPERKAVMARVQGACSRARASWGCSTPVIWRVKRKGISSGMGNTCTAVPKEYLHKHHAPITAVFHMSPQSLHILSSMTRQAMLCFLCCKHSMMRYLSQ